MQAEFHLRREQGNHLECRLSRNPNAGMHFHSQIEVYLVLSGEVEVWINDRCNVLRGGEMSVAFSYDAHGYRTLHEAECMYLIVPTDLCGEFRALFAGRHACDPFIRGRDASAAVRTVLERIMAGANEPVVRGGIYVALGTLLDHMAFDTRNQGHDPCFSVEMLLYINENFRGDLTLSTLAGAFSYNPSYLSRWFRETFGIGFNRYVTMLRLREAVLLLRAGEKSVTACALESGFRSLRSFYRAFYEEFGCTPRAYLAADTPT